MKMSVFPEFSLPFNGLHDADFNLAIYEMQNGPVRYDANRLAGLSFGHLTLTLTPTLIYLAMSVSILSKINLMTC